MDKSVALVIQGFFALTDVQKSQTVEELNKYINGGSLERKVLNESVRKSVTSSTINFGPAPSGCPCCGK